MSTSKKAAYRILFLIATPKLVRRAVDVFKNRNVPVQYILRAQGTASSEMMDMLGLGGVDKDVLLSMMPKAFADEMLIQLQKKLHLGMPNSGVAFTIAMSGCCGPVIELIKDMQPEKELRISERDGYEMTDDGYSVVMAIVDQGYSEEVMNIARPMGASGGTVFHSRRLGTEETMQFWGIRVQPEREVVLILVKKEDKMPVMQAIGQKYGIQSEAHGVVLAIPVDGICGLD